MTPFLQAHLYCWQLTHLLKGYSTICLHMLTMHNILWLVGLRVLALNWRTRCFPLALAVINAFQQFETQFWQLQVIQAHTADSLIEKFTVQIDSQSCLITFQKPNNTMPRACQQTLFLLCSRMLSLYW